MITPIINGNNVTFGPCQLSYPCVFEKKKNDKGTDEKFETDVLIPKTETETINAIQGLVEKAKITGSTKCWGGKVPNSLKLPLRDGDDKHQTEYSGCWYISPKSGRKPIILDKKQNPIDDRDEIYGGVWAYVTISIWPYSNSGNGISSTLYMIIKAKDGERFGGGFDAASTLAQIDLGDIDDDDL